MRREGEKAASTKRVSHLRGNGQFGFAVVGESHRQFELEEIVGGRTEDGADFECIALLVPEPDNAFDAHAIMVYIEGQKVGYLPRKAAASYTTARCRHDVDIADCAAVIVGGWDRGEDDIGHFGVKLDVSLRFRFENIREWRPAPTPAAPPPSSDASRGMITGMSLASQQRRRGIQLPTASVATSSSTARAMIAGMSSAARSPSRPGLKWDIGTWRYLWLVVALGCVGGGVAYLSSSTEPAPPAVVASQPAAASPAVIADIRADRVLPAAPAPEHAARTQSEPIPLPRARPALAPTRVSAP